MVTRERKQALCERHRRLLELIYHFGRGVMYQKHVLQYMSIFESVHEIDASKALQDLKYAEIVDTYSFFGAKIIKLKKFPIYFLQGKERTEVFSIKFSAAKVKKSAFLNQIILKNANGLRARHADLDKLVQHYLTDTTYFAKDKQSYVFLQNQIRGRWCTPYAETEVPLLVKAKAQGHMFASATTPIESGYNLNSMQASNIYLGLKITRKTGDLVLCVDILDVNGLISAKAFTDKIIQAHQYINAVFDRKKIGFQYRLHVQSEERRLYILRHEKTISDTTNDVCREPIQWKVVNLDLEKTLFKGQKVFLGV